jgi:hypothetical protein
MDEGTPRGKIYNAMKSIGLVKTTPMCSAKPADVQLIPDRIEITSFNGLTDRLGVKILKDMIVSYKYINNANKTIQVINSRVLKNIPCIEYQLPVYNGDKLTIEIITGVAEKRNDWVEDDQKEKFCNENYKKGIFVNVPFDVEITGSSIGKRFFSNFTKQEIRGSSGEEGGSRRTRKYKKKRTQTKKKRRGPIKCRTRKRK